MSLVGGPKNAYFCTLWVKNVHIQVGRLSRKGKIMSTLLLNAPQCRCIVGLMLVKMLCLLPIPANGNFGFTEKKGKVEKPHQISKLGKQLLMKCFLLFQNKMGYFTELQHRIVKVSNINIVEKINELMRKIFHSCFIQFD